MQGGREREAANLQTRKRTAEQKNKQPHEHLDPEGLANAYLCAISY